MSEHSQNINDQLNAFKQKYYLNLALKGLLLGIGMALTVYFVVNVLEYSFRFGSAVRLVLLLILVGAFLYCLINYIAYPFYLLFYKKMSDEEAARKIGNYFPEINDRLLNIIQLQKDSVSNEALRLASIKQKTSQVLTVPFQEAVNLSENRKYLKFFVPPLLIIIIGFLISPSIFTTSTQRIVNYNEEYLPKAPFNFKVSNNSLRAFKNEDFKLDLVLDGNAIPENVYLIEGKRKIKMAALGDGLFTHTFNKIQNSRVIHFEAAGFSSQEMNIDVVSRPDLKSFNIYLDYPNYVNRKNETLQNVGNLQIPEGTTVKWQVNTLAAQEASLKFEEEEPLPMNLVEDQLYEFEKSVKSTQNYELLLANEYSANKETIKYKIDVLKDQFPQISLNVYQDTLLYSYLAFGGEISDDYGLIDLTLNYQIINNKGEENSVKKVQINIDKSQPSQRYYYQWNIDSLGIEKGNAIKYWLTVYDNDRINGSKSSKTGTYTFKIPTKKEIEETLKKETEQTENEIDKRVEEAKALKEKIEEAEQKLKGKKELNWQDKNLLKDIINKKEELNKAIEELKKQNAKLNLKNERFNEQDQRLQEKVKQLQQIMEDLLDEDTKKLYEELQKLLDEQTDLDQIQDLLNKMNRSEKNLEQELERSLELFKRMMFDQNLSKAVDELKKQVEKQEELLKETEELDSNSEQTDTESPEKENDKNQSDSNNKNDKNEKLADKQEELQEEFKDFEESLEKLKEENQSLKNPKSLPDTKEEQESIKLNQQKSKEQLQNNQGKQSKESQRNAQKQMQKMAEQLETMQSNMQMSMMQQNLDGLRDIVHNLIKLSFDQEKLMDDFVDVNQSDPRFVELSQTQLKLKDDAQIVEDSLMSLANRVFQIASFVTREVGEMNEHMDKSVEFIRQRNKPKAVSEQQFAMTSMNNLALLLDDVLQQMQQAMADAQGKSGNQKEQQEGPSLGEMQENLNQQIEELQKSGKQGRELSEELARLAAEQERIRQALQEMQEKMNTPDGQTPGQGIPEKMEETEIDLVNKQITRETIERQRQILTRLLEAEKAMRERELDEERKGETAKDYEKALPKAFEEYFKLKEQEIELLKTIPPKLFPYYKKEVNEYFKRLENSPND